MEQAQVLVVDDDDYIRNCLARLLAQKGIIADCVEAGGRALEMYTEYPYPVVICDMCLDDRNGIALIPQFRGLNPDVKMVMLTAYYAPELERLAREQGADEFLAKPFDGDEVCGIIGALLAETNREKKSGQPAD